MDLNHAVSLILTALLPFVYSPTVPDYVLVLVSSGLQLIKAALLRFAQLALHLGSFELLKPSDDCYVVRDLIWFSLFISLT